MLNTCDYVNTYGEVAKEPNNFEIDGVKKGGNNKQYSSLEKYWPHLTGLANLSLIIELFCFNNINLSVVSNHLDLSLLPAMVDVLLLLNNKIVSFRKKSDAQFNKNRAIVAITDVLRMMATVCRHPMAIQKLVDNRF